MKTKQDYKPTPLSQEDVNKSDMPKLSVIREAAALLTLFAGLGAFLHLNAEPIRWSNSQQAALQNLYASNDIKGLNEFYKIHKHRRINCANKKPQAQFNQCLKNLSK